MDGIYRRTSEVLAKILDATVDIASDVIGVVLLHIQWPHHVSGQNTIAKAGGEALNLSLDAGGHIHGYPPDGAWL